MGPDSPSKERHKEDLAGGTLPSGDFGENAAWWWIMGIIEGLTLPCGNSMFDKSSSTIQKQTARFCPEKRFSGTDSISGTSAEKAGESVCLLDVMSV
jgi:hypothetical protein